jgi:streptogramin lyase
MSGVWGEKEGTMLLRLKEDPKIDNLRSYPADIVEKLRALLAAGAQAYPDPRRKRFYDVQNGSRMFYIHLSPTGKVWLLATWVKECQPLAAANDAALDETRV